MIKKHKKIAISLYLICIALLTTACSTTDIVPKVNTAISEECEKGSFKKGGFLFSDYWIDLECPYSGHPHGDVSGDSLWSTYYETENGERVDVDIFGIEGDLGSLINELAASGFEVSKGVLWDNDCYFYIDEITVALIPLGNKNYLQIEFEHEDGVVVDNSSIPDTFTMKITLAFLRDEEETTEIDEEDILNEGATTILSKFLAGDRTYLEETQEEIWYIPNFQDDTLQYEYTYLDLDEDNVDELLIQTLDDPRGYNGVFHVEDGKIYCWNSDSTDMQCRDYPLRDGTMVRQYDYAGTRSYHIFWYDSDGEVHWYSKLFAREELIPEDSTEPCPYYEIDGMELNVEEFELNLKVLVTDYLLERDEWKKI